MNRRAGSLMKDAGKMKWRRPRRAGDVVERYAGAQLSRQIGFGSLDTVRVIGVRGVSAGLPRQAVSRESGFQHVIDELKRRPLDPERFNTTPFERIGYGGLESCHEFVKPPVNARVAWDS